MANCEVEGGGVTPFGLMLSDWLGLGISAWLAYEMLGAQEEAEDAMEEIAKTSLDAAEELFDAHMDLRDQDQVVYDFANEQPDYEACNRDIHAIQTKREATAFIKQSMGSVSRFDCGNKQAITRQAAKAFILGTMSEMQSQEHYELTLEDSYLQNKYDAMTSVALGSSESLGAAFSSSAALWGAQYQSATVNAAGAIASGSYFGQSIAGRWGNKSQQGIKSFSGNEFNSVATTPHLSSLGGW